MWTKVLNVIGWLLIAGGLTVSLVCLLSIFNPAPGDFERLSAVIAVIAIAVFGLPAAVVGLVFVVITARGKSGAAT